MIRNFVISKDSSIFIFSLLRLVLWFATLWSGMISHFVIQHDSLLNHLERFVTFDFQFISFCFRCIVDLSLCDTTLLKIRSIKVRKSIMVNIGREYRWDHPKLPKFVQLAIILVNNPYFQKLLGSSLVTISLWQCGTSKMAVGHWGQNQWSHVNLMVKYDFQQITVRTSVSLAVATEIAHVLDYIEGLYYWSPMSMCAGNFMCIGITAQNISWYLR